MKGAKSAETSVVVVPRFPTRTVFLQNIKQNNGNFDKVSCLKLKNSEEHNIYAVPGFIIKRKSIWKIMMLPDGNIFEGVGKIVTPTQELNSFSFSQSLVQQSWTLQKIFWGLRGGLLGWKLWLAL